MSNNGSGENAEPFSTNDSKSESFISLHPIERKILSILYNSKDNWVADDELIKRSELYIDQIRRGIEWLRFKNLITIEDTTEFKFSLKSNLLKNNSFLLPERKLVNCVKNGLNIVVDIVKSDEFSSNENEVFAAIKHAKNNGWINIKNKQIMLLSESENLSKEEMLIEKLIKTNTLLLSDLDTDEVASFDLLSKRPNVLDIKKISNKKYKISDRGLITYEEFSARDNYTSSLDPTKKILENKLTPELLANGQWRHLIFQQIDVEAPLPLLNCGRKNPLIDFIDEVKEILIGMGFSEIEGNLSQSSFWNFDALFIPQDHSARDMQDTFYLTSQKDIVSSLPSDKLIKDIAKIHEDNWDYKWNVSESKPYVLRTHTTPVTIQYLAKEKPEDDKVFLIGRVFRNEKVSFKHLVEFHQVEGIFTSKNANLKQLMGIQTEFYHKLGIKKIKFWPTFFPYTEPSIQSMIYNDKFDKWIELFGMGIFRPEVTDPLGLKNPVLAWGGGFERLAMLRFNLDDIRELYSNNLTWLKGVSKCLL